MLALLAEFRGHSSHDERKITRLKESEIAIYEPRLKGLVRSTNVELMSTRGFRTPAASVGTGAAGGWEAVSPARYRNSTSAFSSVI